MSATVGHVTSYTAASEHHDTANRKIQKPKDIHIFGGNNHVSANSVSNLPGILSGNCSYGT